MIRQIILALLVGVAIAFPNPDSKAITQQQSSPTVTTPLGSIQGSILATRLGKPIYAFRGIRYAKAPINELRFQPPVPVEKWESAFNATVDGPDCPQLGVTHTSEDCLLLNVYTTKLPKAGENEKRSVLVFFHAGGFHSGSTDSGTLSPKYLLDEDIVLVIPNYRLGSLGFLSTGDKEAPGNNGLKDQVQALKWVKANIASFGGDPECVTIAGYSVGGASVTLHLVSPLSRGLFHKAIAMSGSSYGNWPVPQNQLQLAKKQARLVNCPEDTPANIIKCLKSKPADELAESVPKFKEFGSLDPAVIWLPVIEQDFGQPRFLTAHPVELIQSDQFAKVPFLTGVTTDEFVSHAFAVINNPKLAQDLDKNFEKNAPIAFIYERDTDNSKAISKELKKFYLEDKHLDNSSLSGLVQLYSDAIVGFAVNRAAKLLAEKSNESVYYYRFNYKGRHSNFYLPDTSNTVPYGAAHLDDLIYLFQSPNSFSDYKENDPETDTIDKMIKLWANFARTGKPIPEQSEDLDNVKWEPFTTKTKKYLDIGNKLILNENLYEKRYSEWEKLFPLSKYQGGKNKKQHG